MLAYSSCCYKVASPRTESDEAEFAQVVHAEPGNATAEGPVNMPTMAWITLAAQNQL